jgi:hypothetical protein
MEREETERKRSERERERMTDLDTGQQARVNRP